ncbi:MAG: MBL fold metallo-hydrolase [Pseudomonadota bacterium]
MARVETTDIGEFKVMALTDGGVEFTPDLFPGTDPDYILGLLKAAGQDAIQTNFNAFAVMSGDDVLLVDAGPRDLFGDTCGFLPEALEEAGIAPEAVTHLLFTHLHPDHTAGAVTADGAAVFPNATVFVDQADHAFWTKETFADETMQGWQGVAKGVLAAYAGRIEQTAGAQDLVRGVSLVPLPGHTPGHIGFRVDDGASGFLHIGDVAHAPHVQLADPEVAIVFDVDADTARATRKRTLDMLAADGLVFSGGHMLSPKFARLTRKGSGFVWEADT